MATISEFINKVGFAVNQSDIAKVNGSINGIKNLATKALGAIGIGLSISGIKQAIEECVSFASEAEEMQNKFDVVFEGMTDTVEAWSQNYADAIGRSSNDIKTYLADAQNLLVGFMGTDRREDAAAMSEAMTSLAMDLASFSNIDEASAINWMTKAVIGETEAARSLGAILDDTTRAQAMHTLGLEGTYEALDQATKMQVNYQAILEQSPDAVGDCERSVDSYRSTLINFQSKLKEIKTTIGQFFMPTLQKLLKVGANHLITIRNAIQRINDFAESIGGAERILGVLAATATTVFAIMNWSRITSGLSAVLTLLSRIKLSTLALVAGVLLLFLVIDDLIAFVRGDNSVIGVLFEKAGIDCEKARGVIVGAIEAIKGALATVGGAIKGAFSTLSEHPEAIKAIAVALGILTAALVAGNAVIAIHAAMMGLASAASAAFGVVMAVLTSPITLVVAAIAALIAIGYLLISNWETVKAFVLSMWNTIVSFISSAMSSIYSTVTSIFSSIWSGVSSTISGIYNTIVSGFNSAVSFIRGLASQAFSWGADIIGGIVNGIKSRIGEIAASASSVASTIGSYLHFSVPDTGPLSDFDSYMPDMVNLMTSGMKAGETKIGKAVASVAGTVRDGITAVGGIGRAKEAVGNVLDGASRFSAAKTASPSTVSTIQGGNVSKSVVQNVEINNQFNGEKVAQQKAAKTMNKSADDVTALLARGLAYAR